MVTTFTKELLNNYCRQAAVMTLPWVIVVARHEVGARDKYNGD